MTHPVAIFACVACGTTKTFMYLQRNLHPVLRASILSPDGVSLVEETDVTLYVISHQ